MLYRKIGKSLVNFSSNPKFGYYFKCVVNSNISITQSLRTTIKISLELFHIF
jgi:hypothetical protein